MSDFNTNKNSFLSSLQSFKTDVHSFQILGISKGSKNEKQQKKAVLTGLNETIQNIDTDDFGIRVILVRTNN